MTKRVVSWGLTTRRSPVPHYTEDANADKEHSKPTHDERANQIVERPVQVVGDVIRIVRIHADNQPTPGWLLRDESLNHVVAARTP